MRSGTLADYGALPGVFEEFYAISIRRQFESPALRELLLQTSDNFLARPPVDHSD